MQYQSECLSALKSMANIHKPFEKNVYGHHEIIILDFYRFDLTD